MNRSRQNCDIMDQKILDCVVKIGKVYGELKIVP